VLSLPTLLPYRRPDPVVDTIWVVVPLSRPEWLGSVLRNYRQQVFRGTKLCIVENGRAIGACIARGANPDLLLTTEEHVAVAKNTALAELRRRGAGFWTTWDDDDWYGPEYLAELAGHARDADFVGKDFHFTDLAGTLYFCHPKTVGKSVRTLAGACLGGFVAETPDFPLERVGEDTFFCLNQWTRGAKLQDIGPYHYVYQRDYPGAVHTWKKSTREFLRVHRDDGAVVLGEVDRKVVIGEKPITTWSAIEVPDDE